MKIANLLCLLFCSISLFGQISYRWEKKNDFPGPARSSSVSFTIGNKGYVCTGEIPGSYLKDLWEYDPISDSWTQKADFPGQARAFANSFVVSGKAYVGLGSSNGASIGYNDLWEYNPVNNQWIQKADFPGTLRDGAVSFAVNGKGYFGAGRSISAGNLSDFWQYNPTNNTWLQIGVVPGPPRSFAIYFVIGNEAYVGYGYEAGGLPIEDLWKFNGLTQEWVVRNPTGITLAAHQTAFSMNGNGYICTGSINDPFSFTKKLYQYDPLTDVWQMKEDLPDTGRVGAFAFAIQNKGYIGSGGIDNGSKLSDIWEYAPASDTLIISSIDSVCIGQTIKFYTVDNPGANLNWNFPGGIPDFSTSTEPEIIYNTAGTFDVKVKVVKGSYTDSVKVVNKITVLPNPPINTKYAQDFYVKNEVNPLPQINHSGQLTFTGTEGLIINNSTGEIDLKQSSLGEYSITISSLARCAQDTIIKITIEPEYYIPNVFTPNNDDVNDFFFAKIPSECKVFHGKIFNRWGNLIFEWTNQNDKWGGNNQPAGVYYYILDFETISDKKYSLKGAMNLVR